MFLALSVIADDFILHDAISIKSLCSQCMLRFFKMVFLSFSLVLTNNRQWQWKGNVLMTKFASFGLKVPSHCSASLQKKIFPPFRPQFGLRIGGHPPRPSPGSATAIRSILEFEKSPTAIQNSFSYPFCIFARKKSVTQGTILTKSPDLLPSGVGILFSIARILLNPLLPADKSSGYLTSEESSGILDRRMLALPEA